MESCREALKVLMSGAQRLGLELSSHQQGQFKRFCSFLLEQNRKFNLTGARSPDSVMKNLFLDSLTLSPLVPPQFRFDKIRVIDVGSGAGIPGLPLKILFPQWSLALIESTGKKAQFIREAATELGLEDVTVLSDRAEEIGRDTHWRDRADFCLARAVSSLPTLIELCAPLVNQRGLMAFPKSGPIESELDSATPALRALRSQLSRVVPVPEEIGLGEGRIIVLCKKVGETPANYPRRIGLARSQPIGS